MAARLAFAGIVLIWSTTPLAIKWSVETVGFLFASSTRMALGGLIAAVLLWLTRTRFGMNRRALYGYTVSGLGIYVAMLFGYWGAQYISSGWISVLWGLSPMLTGIFAHFILGERFSWNRITGVLMGIGGLAIIFLHSAHTGTEYFIGVALVLVGVLGQSSTAVWLKHVNCQQPGLAMTTGGLAVAVPLFAISWFIFDGNVPESIPLRSGLSIVYLALFGSVIGFSLYFYLIHAIEASKVALTTLMTPVFALLLGNMLNNEPITLEIILGALLILGGLGSFEWGNKLLKLLRRTLKTQ